MTLNAFQLPPPGDWQAFERLARDLFSAIWGDNNAEMNGRTGQPQSGVDVYGTNAATGKREGVQCKGKDGRYGHSVSVSELQEEVEKALTFTPSLSCYYLVSTGPADATVQKEARLISEKHASLGLFPVHVFGWDHLLNQLQDHPDVVKKHFAALAAAVLGLNGQAEVLQAQSLGRVLVVELRGLVDTSDRPLISAVPSRILGRREDCMVDVRPLLTGAVPNVSAAIDEIAHLRRQVQRARGGASREHVTVVAGGVLQVPLLFYAGVLLDDEGQVVLMDWERTRGHWQELDQSDDGIRFGVEGLPDMPVQEAVLAVSASYRADLQGIEGTFPGLPVVHLQHPDPKPNRLWSEDGQASLASQFIDAMAQLANQGVKTVHLVLAAPASLCIRFGRSYDPRNMPEVRCYQHERNHAPAYPWSVRMPTSFLPVAYLQTRASLVAAL